MTDTTAASDGDAVDVLRTENARITDLLADWNRTTTALEASDDVDTRWDRGSAAKLLVQHIAARESAKDLLASNLDACGATELAGQVRGDEKARKEALSRLDELGRGHQAITLANPQMDAAVEAWENLFEGEVAGEDTALFDRIRATLDHADDADVPSAKKAYAESMLDPHVEPTWYDRFTLIRRLRARYQHLRFAPSGGTKPGLDQTRESDNSTR